VETDDPEDDSRFKIEIDVLIRLVGLLQNVNIGVRRAAMEAITAMSKFSRLIYHFVLCKD
jgi:hypothetical protein